MALTEMRLWNDTLAEMYKEERLEQQKNFSEQMDKMRKHYGRIIAGLIISLCLFIGGVIGGVIYVISNYEFAFYTEQNVDSSDNSTSTINDGIHVNSD